MARYSIVRDASLGGGVHLLDWGCRMTKSAAGGKAARYGGKKKREIYLTPEEDAQLKAAVSASGKNWQDYARHRLFGRQPQTMPAVGALAELQKLNALIETKGMPVELRAAIERVGRDLCAEASKELEV